MFLGNKATRAFISGQQGKGSKMRGTNEQRQLWGTGNIGIQVDLLFYFGEQCRLFQGNKGASTPSGRASHI